MEFAKKQLEKFGWKEGDGLGKDNQGILSAIKPALKVGKEGMGYDLSKELVDTWWTRAYDDSLKRINVQEDDSSETIGVSLQQDDEDNDSKLETTERPFQRMKKRMMKASFPTFAKGATLSNGEMITEHDNEDDDTTTTSEIESKSNTTSVKQLTDEELFKACGGRTAHKAARFGLKLNGKLARIAAQEEAAKQALLASQLLTQSSGKSLEIMVSDNVSSSKKKKKKLRNDDVVPSSLKSEAETLPEEIVHEQSQDQEEETPRKKRKKDKKRKREEFEDADKHNESNNSTPLPDEHIELEQYSTETVSKSKKHKKKKSKRDMEN